MEKNITDVYTIRDRQLSPAISPVYTYVARYARPLYHDTGETLLGAPSGGYGHLILYLQKPYHPGGQSHAEKYELHTRYTPRVLRSPPGQKPLFLPKLDD